MHFTNKCGYSVFNRTRFEKLRMVIWERGRSGEEDGASYEGRQPGTPVVCVHSHSCAFPLHPSEPESLGT